MGANPLAIAAEGFGEEAKLAAVGEVPGVAPGAGVAVRVTPDEAIWDV